MQFVLNGGARRCKLLLLVAAICVASSAHAQVSLSVLAKAVSETGATASNSSPSEPAPESNSGSHPAVGSQVGVDGSSLTPTPAKSANNFGSMLERGAPVGQGGQSPNLDARAMNALQPSGLSTSGGGGMGMDPAEADKLAGRREMAIGIAAAGGLFLFGIAVSSAVTRNRRMSLGRHE